MKSVSQLIKIGELAVVHQQLQSETAQAKSILNTAYATWKVESSIDHIEPDTDDWDEMMQDTKPAYMAYKKAKQAENNAKQRLKRATLAYCA